MTRINRLALAIATFTLAACGGGDSTGPAPAPAPAPSTGTITLLNESSTSIVAVYFSGCEDSSWGANRLAESETLAPGALRSWSAETGCYDFKASTGVKSATWYDRSLAAGDTLRLAVPSAVDAMVGEISRAAAAVADLKTR